MKIQDAIKDRVIGNPRSTALGIAVAVVALLLYLGAARINAVTESVTALNGLARALADGWQAMIALPLAGWLLGKKD